MGWCLGSELGYSWSERRKNCSHRRKLFRQWNASIRVRCRGSSNYLAGGLRCRVLSRKIKRMVTVFESVQLAIGRWFSKRFILVRYLFQLPRSQYEPKHQHVWRVAKQRIYHWTYLLDLDCGFIRYRQCRSYD